MSIAEIISDARYLKNEFGFESYEWREAISSVDNLIDDFEVGNYRFIKSEAIDEIMQEELLSDLYVLGGCTPWFIAEITGLDTDAIEKAQAKDSYEVLGALLAKDIETVQSKMVQYDSYGHHFNHYDGNEIEWNDYYIFRTN